MKPVKIRFDYLEILSAEQTGTREVVVIGVRSTPENIATLKEILGEEVTITINKK